MLNGEIVTLGKGFGFLKIEGYNKDVFFHMSELVNCTFDQLAKGDSVTVGEVGRNDKGQVALKIELN